MEENNITFLKNYFDKEIVLYNDENELEKKFTEDSIITESLELKSGDYVLVSNQKYVIHIVKPGETLQSISAKYSVEEEYIKKLNKLEKIFIGQQLFI